MQNEIQTTRAVSLLSSSLLVAGLTTTVIAFVADYLALGESYGFGGSQLSFLLIGLSFLVCGLIIRRARGRKSVLIGPVLTFASLLTIILVLEGGSHLVEKHVRNLPYSAEVMGFKQAMVDPELGLRMKPFQSGHDAWGFRNDHLPKKVEIIAIGDSQTWGINAERENAWPQKMASMSGHSVYNMSLGSYGPLHYETLTKKGILLSPRIMLVALYLGNDLYDAYRLAYTSDHYASLRSLTQNGLLPDTISTESDRLSLEAKHLLDPLFEQESASTRNSLQSLALIRVLRKQGKWRPESYSVYRKWAEKYPEYGAFFENTKIRTVFTPAYRLLALNLDEPRILEGLRVTKESLLRIHEHASKQGIKVLFVIIPTKESVFASIMEQPTTPDLEKLVKYETDCREMILQFCQTHQMQTYDLLPSLKRGVRNNQQIYPESIDGHPNDRGYRIMAWEILKTIQKLRWI